MNKMTKDLPVQAPFAEARQVCEAIHGDLSFTMLRFKRKTTADDDDGVCGTLIPAGPNYAKSDTFNGHVKLFSQYRKEGLELFAVVGCTDGKGHGNANIEYTSALAVDFDNGYSDMLRDSPLVAPSFRVETSKDRYHAVWILDEKCPPEQAELMLKAMALRLGGDLAYAKISQIIRLPGFTHHKHGTVPELIEMSGPIKTFTLNFLKRAFDVPVIQNHLRSAIPRLNDRLQVAKTKETPEDEDHLLEDVEGALSYLKEDADDYTPWFSTLSALGGLGEAGKRLAEKFSRYSNKFDADGFARKWNEVLKHPGHLATVFLRAQQRGWINPGFRNQVVFDKEQTLTDRDFGRMIADKMGNEYAVQEKTIRGSRKHTYYLFGALGYRPIDDIDKRDAVNKAGKAVLKDLTDHHSIKSDTLKRMEHKIGSNRTLDDVCDHVAEVLILKTRSRVVEGYPYLNVANGVLNLLSRQLIPNQYRAVPVGGASPVVYDPAAKAPVFKKTAKEVFEGDMKLVRYFMRVMGYMMLGQPKEQIFLILYGPSAGNGKNTLMDIIEYVMGTYAMKLTPKAILEKSHVNDSATPSTARLEGKRLSVVSEPSAKHQLDSGAIKSMVGDLSIPVRDNYEAEKDISITFLLVILANKLPKVHADDEGLWRRAKIIPFNRTFRGDEVDRDLPAKLRAEAPGILNLLLAGASDYLANGLMEPEIVTNTIAVEREAIDTVAAFLKDTMRTNVDDETPMKMIFQLYENWRAQNHTYLRMTKQALGKELAGRGFKKTERGHCVYHSGLTPIEVPD